MWDYVGMVELYIQGEKIAWVKSYVSELLRPHAGTGQTKRRVTELTTFDPSILLAPVHNTT